MDGPQVQKENVIFMQNSVFKILKILFLAFSIKLLNIYIYFYIYSFYIYHDVVTCSYNKSNFVYLIFIYHFFII